MRHDLLLKFLSVWAFWAWLLFFGPGGAIAAAPGGASDVLDFRYEMAAINATNATAYVSPDMPSRLAFIAKDWIPEGTVAWLVFDLPEGVQPVGLCMRRESVQSRQIGPGEKIQRDGQPYVRHQFKVSGYKHEVFLYLATALAPGTPVGPIYYHGRKNSAPASGADAKPAGSPEDPFEAVTAEQPVDQSGLMSAQQADAILDGARKRALAKETGAEHRLPMKVIRIHKVRQLPKRLLIGEAWETMPAYEAWPDFEKHYTALGMNLISLYMHTGSSAKDAGAVRAFVNRCRKAGIWVGATMSVGSAMERYGEREFPNLSIRTAEGESRVSPDKLSPFCPSYRGEIFERVLLEPMRNMAACGLSMVLWDNELPYGNFEKKKFSCFCDRCLQMFQEFLAARYPALPREDPRVFEKIFWTQTNSPPDQVARYEGLHNAWQDFLSDQIAGWFRLQRQTFEAACAEYGARSAPRVIIGDYGTPGPWKQIYYRLWYQPKNLTNGLDFVMPIYYAPGNPKAARDKAANEMRVARVRWRDFNYPARNLLPWVTAGWTGGGANTVPYALYCTLLEVLVNGAHGMVFYDGCGMDAADCDVISRVIDAVTPVEDILIDGEHVTAETGDPEAVAHGQRLGDAMVLLISEYGKEKKDIEVSLPVTKSCRVTDLVSGRDLATVTPAANKFRVTLDTERVALIHVHP